MVKPLAPGFKLGEGNGSSEEIWQLCEEAYKENALWKVGFKDCKKKDILPWLMNVFTRRWKMPDITFYTITEESTGYD
jgi:hypothetical protein